jgi:TM2 domain-containing membrane protein YozV
MPATTTPSNSASAQPVEIDLKDPRLAAFLAWLLPGLGHLYQGRTGKGILFFVCIVGTFVYGLVLSQGRAVYASTNDLVSFQFLDSQQGGRWQYLCQLGVGLPAMPAIVQRQRILADKGPLFDWFRPPVMNSPPGTFKSPDQSGNFVQHPNEAAMWNHDLADMFELGTVFTVIAGLLNLLVIFDAYGGPLVILPQEDKQQSGKEMAAEAADEKS